MTLMADIFAQDRDAVAISLPGDIDISYGRFLDDVDTLAWWLDGQSVGPGSTLAIRPKSDRSYWAWVFQLAAMRLGCSHAIVSADTGTLQKAAELGFDTYLTSVPGDSGPQSMRVLFLRPEGLTPLAEQLSAEIRPWDRPEAEAQGSRMSFTSGTTGVPRALSWSQKEICSRVDQARRSANIGATTRTYAALGLLTTAGFRYPLATWSAGGTVLRRGDSDEVTNTSRAIALKSNLMVTSPINLRNHLQSHQQDWPGKAERTIIVLGGRLPVAVRNRALSKACARIEINYGSTETGSIARGDAAIIDRHPGAVGFAREKVRIEVVDADGNPVPANRPGRVRVKSPGMSKAYEGEAGTGEGKQGFRDGWFYPGDVGVLFEDGLLAIEGRTTETANLGGVKVPVLETEERLLDMQGVRDACLLPVRLGARDELAVVLVLDKGVKAAALRPQIKDLLPQNCPFRLVRAPKLPRNAMGKLPRRRMAERLSAAFSSPGGGNGRIRQPEAV